MTRYLLPASLPLPARRTPGTASPASSRNARSARLDRTTASHTSGLREIGGRRPCAPTSRASTRLRVGGRQRASPAARGASEATAVRARPPGPRMNGKFNLARSARAANDAAPSGGGQVCACLRLTQRASRAAGCRRRSPRPPAGPAPSSPRPATRPAAAEERRRPRTPRAAAERCPPSPPPSLPDPSAPRPLAAHNVLTLPAPPRALGTRAAALPLEGTDCRRLPPSRPPGLNATRVLAPRSPLAPGPAGDHEALEVSSAPSCRASARAAGCARRSDAARGPVRHVSNVEGCSVPRSRQKGRGAPRSGRRGQGAEGTGLEAGGRADAGPGPSPAGPDVLPASCPRDAGGRCTSGFTPFSPRCAPLSQRLERARLRPPRAAGGLRARGPGGEALGHAPGATARRAGVPAAGSRGRCALLAPAGPRRQGAFAPALPAFREPSCFAAGGRRGGPFCFGAGDAKA